MKMAVGRRFDINAVMITIASSAVSYKLTQNIDNSIAPTGVRVATTAALRTAVSGGQVNIEAMASDAFSSGLQLTFQSMAGSYYVHNTADNFPKTATDINTNINIDINDPKWSARLGDMASKQRQAAEAAAETKSSRRFTAADLKAAENTASIKLPSITLFGRSEESTSAFSPTLFGRVRMGEDKTINQKIPASRQTQTNSMNKWERLLDRAANSPYVDAFTRGVENFTDATKGLAVIAWDGSNAISDIAFGISTQGSRDRNMTRGIAINEGLHDFAHAAVSGIYSQGGGAKNLISQIATNQGLNNFPSGPQLTEVATEFAAPIIFGAAVAGPAGLLAGTTVGTIRAAGMFQATRATLSALDEAKQIGGAIERAGVVSESTRLVSSISRVSSDTANAPFLTEKAIAEGWMPPYPSGVSLRQITTASQTKFLKFFNGSDPVGGFLVREKEVSSILNNPEALRIYLGLRESPTKMADVYAPTNTNLMLGRIGSQPSFGLSENSGFQYQLLNKIPPESFRNIRPILQTSEEFILSSSFRP